MMFRVLVFLFATTLPVIASRPAFPEPNGISCGKVLTAVRPCLSFIKGSSKPSAACCGGVEELSKLATKKPDKIAVCGCLKNIMSKIAPYDASLLPKLPGKCGVKITLPPIDQKYDCKKMPSFHISDSKDEPRHEKQDGLIHAGIKANYIHKSTISENYEDILDVPMNVEHDGMAHDVPMNVENDGMAHDGMVSENIQGVPMTEEHDRMVAKGTVSENYKDIKNVHMIEEHERRVPEDTVSENYKYIEDVPMTEEQESITSKGMVSENYNEDDGVILDVLMGFITGLIAGLKE